MASGHADFEVRLPFLEELAKDAAPLFKRGFGCRAHGGKITCKASPSDLLTQYDSAVENLLIEKIKAAFPHHQFFCEESAKEGQRLTDEPTWIIDPIDGTTNFFHGIPFACSMTDIAGLEFRDGKTVSIAFARNREVRLAAVYAPINGELFTAELGKGAWLNGCPLKASGCEDKGQALVCVSFGVSAQRKLDTERDPEKRAALLQFKECVLHNAEFVSGHCRDIRHFGSTALELCFIGAGRLDCVVAFGPKEWDMAAGCLVLREAGGVCSDFAGETQLDLGKHQVIAAATPKLLKEIQASVRCP